MIFRISVVALSAGIALGACARPGATPETQPKPAPTGPARPPVIQPSSGVTRELVKLDSAPTNWQRLDPEADGVLGVGSDRAIRELLNNRKPERTVVVAVVDGGVDTSHAFLRPILWTNPGEIAGNGRDDDNNGFIDDTYGWNFSVTPNGESVYHDTFEVTRLYAACAGLKAGTGIQRPPAARCDSVRTAYTKQARKIRETLGQIENIDRTLTQINRVLERALGSPNLTRDKVERFRPTDATENQARSIWLQLADNGLTAQELKEAKEAYESQSRYGLDTLFDPHAVGTARGSRDVTGPDAKHGTHVAGIIAAVRGSGNMVEGIAPSVRIMAVRAVPDGDERDPDIARAIRYAVDNGAHIINMSFGKPWSPEKASVDSAMRYAADKGVLLIHAAGNDGENNDSTPAFPTRELLGGTTLSTWIEVGASSWKGKDQLATSFSNYGKKQVDLFAPGEDILSTVPGGGVKRESGTSMAAPVTSGVAALLMAYFPKLTALEVKDILRQSVRTFPGQMVTKPGEGQSRIQFSDLSSTGGLLDAYAAVKLAIERSR